MGTNYYACKRSPTVRSPIHIGKKSYGWLFCFEEQDEPYLEPPVVWHEYGDVVKWLRENAGEGGSYVIMNEYDEEVGLDDFLGMIEESQRDPFDLKNRENFKYARNAGGYRFMSGWFI